MRALRSFSGFSLVLMLACSTAAGTGPSLIDVAPGIRLLPGQLQASRSPDGNSLIIKGKDGLVIVDTGRGGAHTRELLDLVSASGLPPVAVINSHWHLDHIGGNALFHERWPNLPILAHPSLDTALAGFHADYRKQLDAYLPTLPEGSAEQLRYQAERDLLALDRKLAANTPVTQSTTMTLAGRLLDVHVGAHAVTEGDLWLFDRETKTLISGDLVTLPVPMFDSACPEGWQQALQEMSSVKFARLVPGHGLPMTPAAFETYRHAFDALLACAAGDAGKASCIDGWFSDAKPLLARSDEAYGRTLLDYYIDQFIATDAPGRARWCAKPA